MTTLAALALVVALNPQYDIRPIDVPPPPIAAFPEHEPPAINAQAWVLYSVDEGAILLSANADTLRAPASVTKVMTALVVVDNAGPDELDHQRHSRRHSHRFRRSSRSEGGPGLGS